MYNATVVSKKKVTDSLFILKVKPDVDVPDFLPGQYIALGLLGSAPRPENCAPDPEEQNPEKIIKRSYSIGSSPEQKDYYEFYIATVDEGILSPRLSLLEESDRLFIGRKPIGTFHSSEAPEKSRLIFVATGTGLAPFTSMLRTGGTLTDNRSVCLLHGVRYENDLAYVEELNSYKETANFSYYSSVSRASDSWEGRKGYVQEFFKDGTIELNPESDHVFLCGNPAMIEEVEGLLCSKGFVVHSKKTPGNLHLEKYW